MPVDTFTGLILGYGGAGTDGLATGPRPAWAPGAVADLHAGGAVMWIAGDGIMFGLMMLVFLMWSRDERAVGSGHGWLESARRASMASLVASHQPAMAGSDAGQAGTGTTAGAGEPAGAAAASAAGGVQWSERGGIDDDEHLAAYNDFLSRLNQGQPGRER
jgi:putative copper resistance protein D